MVASDFIHALLERQILWCRIEKIMEDRA